MKKLNNIEIIFSFLTLFTFIVFGNILTFNIGNRLPIKIADIVALITIVIITIKYRNLKLTRINKKILIFLLIGIVSLFINAIANSFSTSDLTYCLLYPIRILFYLLTANSIVIAFKENNIKFNTIIEFIIICFCIVCLIGFIQLIYYPKAEDYYEIFYNYGLYYPDPDPHINRMLSTYLDPNYLGACLLIPFSFSFSNYLTNKKKKNIIYVLLFTISILLTNSRSAFLGMIIVYLLMILKYFRFRKENKSKDVKLFIYLLIIIGYVVFSLTVNTNSNVINRIKDTVEGTKVEEVIDKEKIEEPTTNNEKEEIIETKPNKVIKKELDKSTNARFESWNYSLKLFKKNPIIGIGYNSIGLKKTSSPSSAAYGVDSSLLLILITTGIIGTIYFIISLIKLIVKLIVKNTDNSFIILTFIISSIVICNFNNVLFYVLWLVPSLVIINSYFELDNKKKKIAIDARMINNSGIGVYIQNLLKNNCYDLALGDEKEIKKYNKNIKVIKYDANIYGIKEQLKFPYIKLYKENIDVLHIPHYNIPLLYDGNMVVTIHDLTHLVYKEFLKNKLAFIYAMIMLKVATIKSYTIITISENTKKDIIKYLRPNKNKIKIIYNGVGEEFVKRNKEDINYLYKKFNIPKNKKLLMYVGNLKPHKNLNRLLLALSEIKNKNDYTLILVGKSFTDQIDLDKLEKELNLNNVIHTGMVSQEELVDLYNLVDLFVFPSLYEGFGLPILESLKCGTPVIASDSSSIPEVGGKMIGYFDATNVYEISKSIEKHINDKEKLDYEKTMKWCNNFKWETVANNLKKELDK